MSTVNIIDCQLGEEIIVHVNERGFICSSMWSCKTLATRVVAIDTRDDMRLVGWKEHPNHQLLMRYEYIQAHYRSHLQTVPDFDTYPYFSWMLRHDVIRETPILSAAVSGVAVNDHTCPACGNNRCSRSERSCWRCGNAL